MSNSAKKRCNRCKTPIPDSSDKYCSKCILTNEDKQEISDQIDAIANANIIGNIVSGNGETVYKMLKEYIKNDKNYEVIIKQI